MNFLKTGLLITGVLLLTCPLRAQHISFTFTPYNTSNTNLSHNTVTALEMDRQGFLWVGTMDGLHRFDGREMKVYRHKPGDSLSLSDDFIHGIYEDEKGLLWISTRNGGINRFNPVTDEFRRYPVSESSDQNQGEEPIYLSYPDGGNKFWLSVGNNSFGFFDAVKAEFKRGVIKDAGKERILAAPNALVEFQDGSFLAASATGLYRIPGAELRKFKTTGSDTINVQTFRNPTFNIPDIISLFADSKAGLIFKSTGEVLHRIPQDEMPDDIKKLITEGQFTNSNRSLYPRIGEAIYTGAGASGIAITDPEADEITFLKPANTDGILDKTDRLWQDKKGGYWATAWGSGLYRLHPVRSISLINSAKYPELDNEFILSVEGDDRKGYWVGSSGGIYYLNHKKRLLKKAGWYRAGSSELPESSVWSMQYTTEGIWGVSKGEGLFFLKPVPDAPGKVESIRWLRPGAGLIRSEMLHQAYLDRRGWLWLGYEGNGIQIIKNPAELLKRQPGELNELLIPEINNRLKIREIYEDQTGDIWLATMESGLIRIHTEEQTVREVRIYDISKGLPHNDIRSIYQQSEKTFWVATYGGGVAKLNTETEKVEVFSEVQGLANNSTYGILGDHDPSVIWISTNNGLSRFNTISEEFINYTEKDGLQNREFNTGAFTSDDKGILVFGGVKGFNIIDTRDKRDSDYSLPVQLTSVKLFNNEIRADSSSSYLQNIRLNYDQNFLSFTFSGLDYDRPEQIQYAYLMDGIDQDWVYAGNRNFASYPNIEPGEYTLRVKAAGPAGLWNESSKRLHIIIDPPWWQTTWFRGIILIAGFGVLVSGTRYVSQRRLRKQIREMEVKNKLRDERERISRDLHDHVGSQLANIIAGLNLAVKFRENGNSDKTGELMLSLKEDAANTIGELRETIWALQKDEIELQEFSKHLEIFFSRQTAVRESMNLTVDLQATEPGLKLSATQALHLFRIVQESVQNSLKYSGADRLTVSIAAKKGEVRLMVKDNGVFRTESAGYNTGHGMGNMKKRAAELNGRIAVDTVEGTSVTVTFPLNGVH